MHVNFKKLQNLLKKTGKEEKTSSEKIPEVKYKIS